MGAAGANRAIGASASVNNRGGRACPTSHDHANHAQSRAVPRTIRTAGFPAGSVDGHLPDAGSRRTAGQRFRDRQARDPRRAAGHPSVQREAPRTAHPLRAGPSRRGGAELVDPAGTGHYGHGRAHPRAGAGGRRAQRPALSERRGSRAHGTGRAHDRAPQAGGRDRRAIHAAQRLYGTRPRPVAADRGAGGHLHRQRAALLARRAAEPHAEGAGIHLAGILVHPGRERTAEQNRQHRARPDQLRRVQHPAGGCRAQIIAAPFQHPLRPARGPG
jgi:hypothetical protein